MSWKNVLLLVLAAPLVTQLGNMGRSAAEFQASGATPSSEASSHDQIQAVVSSQDAEGITQADMSLGFLKNLEAYTVERVEARAKEFLASQGQAKTSFDVYSEATYVESDGVKVAVIRLQASDGSNQVLIAGIVETELKRVTCVRRSAGPVPVSYGACGNKIKEVFGISLAG